MVAHISYKKLTDDVSNVSNIRVVDKEIVFDVNGMGEVYGYVFNKPCSIIYRSDGDTFLVPSRVMVMPINKPKPTMRMMLRPGQRIQGIGSGHGDFQQE